MSKCKTAEQLVAELRQAGESKLAERLLADARSYQCPKCSITGEQQLPFYGVAKGKIFAVCRSCAPAEELQYLMRLAKACVQAVGQPSK